MGLVNFAKRGRIAYITLNNPSAPDVNDKLNSELAGVFARITADDSVDVAIMTGAGRTFCAGPAIDTNILKSQRAKESVGMGVARHFRRDLTSANHTISKPIIAAVNGQAAGAGFDLALACDIRIASEEATFSVTEKRRRPSRNAGSIARLVDIAGMALALDLCLTGRQLGADEALRLQLVSCVVPQEQLLATAKAYARMIAANSKQAVRSAKKLIEKVVAERLNAARTANHCVDDPNAQVEFPSCDSIGNDVARLRCFRLRCMIRMPNAPES